MLSYQIWAKSGADWPQMGQIREFFTDQIQYILAKKSQFVPFVANLIHVWPKSGNLAPLPNVYIW